MKTVFVVAAVLALACVPSHAMLTRPFSSTGLGRHLAAGHDMPSLSQVGNFTHDTFEQVVDHFDPLNTATYKQRYAVDASAWSPGSPIFIFLSGEGACVWGCAPCVRFVWGC